MHATTNEGAVLLFRSGAYIRLLPSQGALPRRRAKDVPAWVLVSSLLPSLLVSQLVVSEICLVPF